MDTQLIKATGREWVTAPYNEKLLAAGHLILTQNGEMNRQLAAQIVICMDEALEEPMMHSQSNASTSTLCLILLEG